MHALVQTIVDILLKMKMAIDHLLQLVTTYSMQVTVAQATPSVEPFEQLSFVTEATLLFIPTIEINGTFA